MHLSTQAIANRMLEKVPKVMLAGLELKEDTADDLIDLLDQAGIKKCFALSFAYGWGFEFLGMGDKELEMVHRENDFTYEQALKYPNRIIPFFSVNPLKQYALDEVRRCNKLIKKSGLKLHFTNSGVNLRDLEHLRKVKIILQYAGTHGMPCLIHFPSRLPDFGKTDVEIFIRELVAKIPRLKIQMAHLGGWGGFEKNTESVFECFIDEIQKSDSIKKEQFLFDIAGVLVDKPVGFMQPLSTERLLLLVELLRKYGLNYILFGSDYTATQPKHYSELLLQKLSLTMEEFEIIYSDNGSLLFQ
jgi:predicted TIM-barrel fold metal-dependent hydrolase